MVLDKASEMFNLINIGERAGNRKNRVYMLKR